MPASLLKSRRAIALAPLALAAGPGHAASWFGFGAERGSGRVVIDKRSLPPFSALTLGGAFALTLRQGAPQQLEVELDDNLQPLLEAEVIDTTLQLREQRALKPTILRLVLTAPRLDNIHLSGAAALKCEAWAAERLSLHLGGAAAAKWRGLDLQRLFADLGGSAMLSAEGQAGLLQAALGGSSGLQAAALQAREATLQIGGSAQATVWAQQLLRASVGGAGGLRYHGQPRTELASSGAGTIKALGEPPAR
ncbi:head GIN domain-containing protein [Aquabacterium sp.]|uniref:head GIN domain-containing protein n=1 Tax=Aquabacterium sp. TaxID=1872578 RepID=UPI003783EB5D